MVQEFWDKNWSSFEPFTVDPAALVNYADRCDRTLMDLVGNVKGKTVLDLGCGNGVVSVYLAKSGAAVTSIDTSLVAINNTMALATFNKVDSLIEPHCLDSTKINTLGRSFDLVVGRFILHHIEPFDSFTDTLLASMTKGGRAIFLENNSRNPLLIFFRRFFVGRFGIPKRGDDEEYPFEPRETEMLKKRFNRVRVYYPEFLFFRMMVPYLFRGSNRMWSFFSKMDEWVYNNLYRYREYSYRQVIEIRKT
jgi:SAM-dependent methyltransferase